MKAGEQYLDHRLIKGCLIPHDSWLPWKHMSMYSRLSINILRDFFQGTLLKIKFATTFLQYVPEEWQLSWGIKHYFLSLKPK